MSAICLTQAPVHPRRSSRDRRRRPRGRARHGFELAVERDRFTVHERTPESALNRGGPFNVTRSSS